MSDKKRSPASFDQQAKNYNSRAGLSEDLCKLIAGTIEQAVGLNESDVIFELGCGTGQIGSALDKLPSQYCGVDLSAGMLEEFGNHHPDIQGTLTQADGREPWPIENNSVNLIFASRALHWIDVNHIVSEAFRVKDNNKAYLLVGRIEGSKNSWEKQLRKHMHKLLCDNGLTPLDGQKHIKILREALLAVGCEAIEPITVSTWHTKRDLKSVIQNWRGKDGLAGAQPSASLKNSILNELQEWAEGHFDTPLPTRSERSYVIYGFKLTS